MSENNQHNPLAESLSALMDNQASEFELQRVLKASESDASIRSTWARYQSIGASLRGEVAAMPNDEFMARVSAALDAEPSHEGKSQVTKSSPVANQVNANQTGVVQGETIAANSNWWHHLGRVGLAASVAVAVVMSVNHFGTSASSSVDVAANTVAPNVATPSLNMPVAAPLSTRNVAIQSGYEMRPQETRRVQFQPRVSGQPNISEEELARYINQLIQVHSDNAAQNSGQGVLPYARVILTEDE